MQIQLRNVIEAKLGEAKLGEDKGLQGCRIVLPRLIKLPGMGKTNEFKGVGV